MSIFRQLMRVSLSVALPRSRFFTRYPGHAGVAYLTFDDGPHPEHTPRLLDLLAKFGMQATFFVIGAAARQHPEIVRRAAAEGHTIANHTFAHARPEVVTARGLIEDADRCSSILADILGKAPALFRPPFGHLNIGKLTGLLRNGYTIALWNRDPKDYATPDVYRLGNAFAALKIHPGDVILMHDIHAHTIAALPRLVARAQQLGIHFGALPSSVKNTVTISQPTKQAEISKA
jgi:peptidoglycan/xylan/chitin deacetylase (PgdA/CDA1 family)